MTTPDLGGLRPASSEPWPTTSDPAADLEAMRDRTTPGQHGPLDLRAIHEEWERVQRANAEYAAVPITGSRMAGPCIRGCGAVARTMRGVCRACLRKENAR